jgi:glycosyltransferase involved in cell wall biosynthesis
MKVLMFGWEFPPYNSGGLGTACYGLTKGLANQGIDVTFVIPRAPDCANAEHVKLLVANNLKNVRVKVVNSALVAYIGSEDYKEMLKSIPSKEGRDIYGKNLFDEVYRYSQKARLIAQNEEFDVIHAHDWLTYRAGIEAKRVSGKPLVIHVHATEFDRTGGNGVHQYVYDVEREGMLAADKIIAVSNFTKNKIVQHYGVNPEKIEVVHNAVEFNDYNEEIEFGIKKKDRVVLFLGRITLQKGPDYFLYAAKKVLELEKNVLFIIAGSGDMEAFIIEKAAELGIADKVLFTGFLRGKEIDRAYRMADLYVMPSVSEPFGITPLEAMRNGTPVIISKQSGVSEVITHCLKVDFWDVNELASKIIGVLWYNEVGQSLKENGLKEVRKFDWNEPSRRCIGVYNCVVGG